jgi:hypothetical protein
LEQPYSVVRGFLNARINLAILRAAKQIALQPAASYSKDGAGLGLFETM